MGDRQKGVFKARLRKGQIFDSNAAAAQNIELVRGISSIAHAHHHVGTVPANEVCSKFRRKVPLNEATAQDAALNALQQRLRLINGDDFSFFENGNPPAEPLRFG